MHYPHNFSIRTEMFVALRLGTSGIMTIENFADYMKVTERTIYRLAAGGQIPAFKLGGTWRFRRGELDQWIATRIGEVIVENEVGGAE